jgi:hypothetical protein
MKADDVWQELYKAAFLEADDEKLQERIQAAKAAIDARLHQLQLDHGGARRTAGYQRCACWAECFT